MGSAFEVFMNFMNNKDDFQEPKKIHYRTIFVAPRSRETKEDAKKRAQHIVELLNEGHDFTELARQYCINYDEEKEGLQVVEVPSDNPDWRPPIIQDLQPGDISEVIERGETFAVAKFEEILPERIKEFREVQEPIRRKLADEKNQKNHERFAQSVREKADVRFTKTGEALVGKEQNFFLR